MSLALAGVCQSVDLVNQLAQTGKCDNDALHTSIYSLLQTNPANTLAVYGGEIKNLKLGVSAVIQYLTEIKDQRLALYSINLLELEIQLNKKAHIKQQLGQRIARLQEQSAYYNGLDDRLFAIMAGIYTDLLSPLRKISITGSVEHLQQTHIQDKIRACLLAGLRSAVLWRQFGGSKWQMIFARRKLLDAAKQHYLSIHLPV